MHMPHICFNANTGQGENLRKKFITMIFFMKMSEAATVCGSERLQESLDAVYGEQKHEKAHTGHACMQINGF